MCFRFFPLVYYPCGCVVLVAGCPHGNFVHSISLLTTFNGMSLNHDHAPWKTGLSALGPYFLSAFSARLSGSSLTFFCMDDTYAPLFWALDECFRFSLRESFILLHVTKTSCFESIPSVPNARTSSVRKNAHQRSQGLFGGNFIELGDPIFCVAAEIQMPTLATGSGDATESKPMSWEKPSPPPEVYRNTVTQQTFQRPNH